MSKQLYNINLVTAFLLLLILCTKATNLSAQNSMTGDGFGGRSWYKAHNYQVGAYSAYTVCGVDSQLYGWGSNFYGEIGNGTVTSTDTAIAVPGMNNVKFYTTGYIMVAIKSDNTAWVWGKGYPTLPFAILPYQMLSNVKFADAGSGHIVFVKNDGTVWAAGNNASGELGNGMTINSATPVQMIGISNAVRAIALGYDLTNNQAAATIILSANGTVSLTGGYQYFSNANNLTPTIIPGLSNIVDIKGGTTAAFALNSNGEVFAFGRENSYVGYRGALGLGSYTGLNTPPTKIIFPSVAAPIIALSTNNDGYHTLALDENGNLYGWGGNLLGQYGSGTNISSFSPILVKSNVIDIFAGETFSYALLADNTLWATGQSGYTNTPYYYGSIWMNLTNTPRNVWTQIDPTIAPMKLCAPKVYGVFPLQLLRFNATAFGNTASLAWQSGNEQNFSRFVLEYSADGKSFEGIATIAVKGSNSNYNYEHRQVSGTAFYRLKMIDKDGSSKYSVIRSVRFSESLRFTISPNPTNDVINIYSKNNTTIKSVQVLSISGKILQTINGYSSGQPINLHGFAAGTYLIKTIYKNGNSEYGKLLKL